MDEKAGMVGTVENKIVDKVKPSTHTTPDAISMQQLFREMADEAANSVSLRLALCNSQNRLAGTQLTGAVFTNITHDHLDYHISFDNYLVAKKKLFDKLPVNAFALLNADDEYFEDIGRDCRAESDLWSKCIFR